MRIFVFYSNLDILISGLEVRFKQSTLNVINAIGLLVNLKMKFQHIKYYTHIFQFQLKMYALKLIF